MESKTMEFKIVNMEEILSLLTQDSYYRIIQRWPLLSSKHFLNVKTRHIKCPDTFYVSYGDDRLVFDHNYILNYFHQTSTSIIKTSESIDEIHPFTTELLNEFKGHLVACGGAITKSIICYNSYRENEDIDLFFYDLDVEQATKLRIEIIEFIINKFKTTIDNVTFCIQRNEFVTTLTVYKLGHGYKEYTTYVYQLIHRIYPDISSIIGGFDLSSCAVAYDGQEIYSTPLGTWSLKNKAIIVDLSRRSTSYEHRLCKYFKYEFTIIFPGLTKNIIDEHIIGPCDKAAELLQKMKALANEYGYNIHNDALLRKRELIGDKLRSQQLKKNILPLLHINDGRNNCDRYEILYGDDYRDYDKCDNDDKIFVRIGIPSYNKNEIEQRYLNKISDYSYDSDHGKSSDYTALCNSTRLRLDCLDSIVSFIEINSDQNIRDKLIDDAINPNIGFTDNMIDRYIKRVDEIRKPFGDERADRYWNKCTDFRRLSTCFGKLTPLATKARYNDVEYNEYRDIMIAKMKKNAIICEEKLKNIKFITKNPGRQWTSSINPIIADPRDWYGKYYIPVLTGIPVEIEMCLRLARLRSIWNMFPDDIFNIILLYIMKNKSDAAWQYI